MCNGTPMKIICDTNVLIFWSQAPERLSRAALRRVEEGMESKDLASTDVSFREIAMRFARKRTVKPISPKQFMVDLVKGMELTVLPITPEIAVLSQSDRLPQKDPADRLIAATALAYKAPLVTSDEKLRTIDGLKTIW